MRPIVLLATHDKTFINGVAGSLIHSDISYRQSMGTTRSGLARSLLCRAFSGRSATALGGCSLLARSFAADNLPIPANAMWFIVLPALTTTENTPSQRKPFRHANQWRRTQNEGARRKVQFVLGRPSLFIVLNKRNQQTPTAGLQWGNAQTWNCS